MHLLPDFHIYCCGSDVLAYAAVASRCVRACALEAGLPPPAVEVHLNGLYGWHKRFAQAIFAQEPHVRLTLDSVRMDEDRSAMARALRVAFGSVLVTRLRRKAVCFGLPTRLVQGVFGSSPRSDGGQYHQEWMNGLCRRFSTMERLVILDADMFLADPGAFASGALHLDKSEFCRGWIYRFEAQMIFQGKQYKPVGTEFVVLSPGLHARINPQRTNHDSDVFDRLRDIEPAAVFDPAGQPPDTFYGACWAATLKGYEVSDALSSVRACHAGGVGHISETQLHSESFNHVLIPRCRIHVKIIEMIDRIGMGWMLTKSFRTRIKNLYEAILALPDGEKKWKETPMIQGEDVLEEIEDLIAKPSRSNQS